MIGDVFRVSSVGGMFGQQIVNVFHYEQTSVNTSGIAEVESLARAFNAGVLAAIAATTSNDASWGTIESRSFVLPGTPPVGFDLSVTVPGEIDSGAAPPTVCFNVKKKTGFLGRKYRGRNYFAGIAQDAVDSGKIAVGAITTFEALKDAMAGTLTWTAGGSPTFRPIIAAIVFPDAPDVPFIRKTPITQCEVDLVLRSQRRREIGVGA